MPGSLKPINKFTTITDDTFIKNFFPSVFFFFRANTKIIPKRPNIEPDAPMDIPVLNRKLNSDDTTPAIKYINMYLYFPYKDSISGPIEYKQYIFEAICKSPPCKNVQVNRRNHCPCIIAVLYFAPSIINT